MSKRVFLYGFFLIAFFPVAFAQFSHINVYPDLEGAELLSALVAGYKTNSVLNYSVARDTLFSKIDAVDDSLECIYSGMKLYLPPGEDPTQAVYLNGIPNGINTEHAYPQSKGATGLGESDMHHLFPTRTKVNTERMSNPLGNIPDNITDTWYYKTTELNSVPAQNIDLYSESTNSKFEPRESVKGNIARAIFYFYTMYKDQADAADPNFFELQRADLCDWHFQDPVDETEWNRTHKIKKYQQNKANPFVLDCSLAARTYCDFITPECTFLVTAIEELEDPGALFTIFPNPGRQQIFIKISVSEPAAYAIEVFDLLGKDRYSAGTDFLNPGNSLFEIPESLPSGIYFVRLTDTATLHSVVKKMQKL